MIARSAIYLIALFSIQTSAEDLPDVNQVEQAMVKATQYYRQNLSAGGGYASTWDLELSEGQSEHHSSPTITSIQPHGTTTVGFAMTKAFQASGDLIFLQGANEAAHALAWCQLSSGGWSSDFDSAPTFASKYHYRRDLLAGDIEPGKRSNQSTLDDNKTQSAILFLLELAHLPESEENRELHDTLSFALKGLIDAQSANGGWPQKFTGPSDGSNTAKKATFPESWPREWSGAKYDHYNTLNDGNILLAIEVLLRAWELTQDETFLKSAERAGDFLLMAQFAEPQAGWAQQYNESMHPVWARKFEPPSLTSGESYGAIQALFELWVATGNEKYISTLPSALDWLESSKLPDGRWSRFYEMKTNRALYMTAETYLLTYDDSNLPTHYGFKLAESFGRKIERMRTELAKSREEILRNRSDPDTLEKWAKRASELKGKVKQALESQEAKGYWTAGDRIDAGQYVEHIKAMTDYLEALKKSTY